MTDLTDLSDEFTENDMQYISMIDDNWNEWNNNDYE